MSRAVKFSSFFFHRKNLNHFYHSWSFCNIGCSLCSQFQKLVYFVIILFSIQMNNPFKVTECVILSKGMAKPNKQRYPWNIYRIKHVKDIVVFLGLKVVISDSSCMFPCSRNQPGGGNVMFVCLYKKSVCKKYRTKGVYCRYIQ